MKFKIKNQINLIFVLIILIVLVLGCDAWVSVNGRIVDESENPVSDAKIIVEQGYTKVAVGRSKDNGSFGIHGGLNTFSLATRIKLTVSKEGYETYEKILSQQESNIEGITIVLKKN